MNWADKRVALVYDKLFRPDTTGEYCRRALQDLCQVKHFLPIQKERIPDDYDLYLSIDDSLRYLLPAHLHPKAWWVIDTHLQYPWDRAKARAFDYVFAAQKEGAERLGEDNAAKAVWLPLACDPLIHQKEEPGLRSIDISFIGNPVGERRRDLLDQLKRRYSNVFFGQCRPEEMSDIYSRSRIVFNCSVKNDLNMRVFEAMASGALLVTDKLLGQGLEEIFSDRDHLVIYRDDQELLEAIDHYLLHEDEREAIARRGQRKVLEKHTYRQRMETILDCCFSSEAGRFQPDSISSASIIVPIYDQPEVTDRCLDSLMRHSPGVEEVILIDNGSNASTRAVLAKWTRLWPKLIIIRNDHNRGYPAAINQGLARSRGEIVVLLNNDTAVTSGWLTRIRVAMEADWRVGLAGPMTNRSAGPQQITTGADFDPAGLEEFANRLAQLHDGQRRQADGLIGFCLAIRRDLIEQIGGFDPRFGVGNFEDTDYCLRAHLMGWRSVIVEDAFVYHEGGVTFKKNGFDYNAIMRENRKKFTDKWKTDFESLEEGLYISLDQIDPDLIFQPLS